MDSNGVLAFVRRLCDDIDASRPVRYGMRSVLVPFAVPAALGLGVGLAGCGDSSPIDEPDEVCDNGLDDDDNGAIDCDDSACAEDEGCLSTDPPCEPRTEYCEDGFDNDGNGETDCADLCCDAFCFARDCPMCAYGVPFQPLENEADCGDDQDEDCDGQLDCCDPDCEGDPLCAE